MLHKDVEVTVRGMRVTVALDIEPDDDDPMATLSAKSAEGNELAKVRVAPNYNLTRAAAQRWADASYPCPREE